MKQIDHLLESRNTSSWYLLLLVSLYFYIRKTFNKYIKYCWTCKHAAKHLPKDEKKKGMISIFFGQVNSKQ
jgi:hypothetical protein